MTFDRTDVLALVFMAVFAMRRMEVRATDARAFPSVDLGDFERWKKLADDARRLALNACFVKFALNNAWYLGFRTRVIPPVLMTGGIVILVGWILALVLASYRWATAKAEAERLGIVVGRRFVPPDAAAEPRSDG